MKQPLFLYALLGKFWPTHGLRSFFSSYMNMRQGKNNHLYLVWRGEKIECPLHWLHTRFRFNFRHAKDSSITIHVPEKIHPRKYLKKTFVDIFFRMGPQSRVEIQETNFILAGSISVEFDDTPGSLSIGKNFITWQANDHDMGPRFRISYGKIIIGDNCGASRGALFRTSDGHIICDAQTGEILNPPADIILGNHVWVTEDVTLLKGARVADDSICATKSLISKQFTEPGVILAGIPARVIKYGVNWNLNNVGITLYNKDLSEKNSNEIESKKDHQDTSVVSEKGEQDSFGSRSMQ